MMKLIFVCCPKKHERGYLPPGIYETTWSELKNRFGNGDHRQNILVGLSATLKLLGQAGCQRVYLGGSFISNKEYPNDFDGCYDDMNIDYNLLDPIFDEDLSVQKKRFGGELLADPTFQGCLHRPYADFTSAWAVRFFQTDRDGNPRGIVAIDPRELLEQ